jgi:hypothetical protein
VVLAVLLLDPGAPLLLLGSGSSQSLLRRTLLGGLVAELHERVIELGDMGGFLVELSLAVLLVGVSGLAQWAGDPQLLNLPVQG